VAIAMQRVLGSCSSSYCIVLGGIPQSRFLMVKFLQQNWTILFSIVMREPDMLCEAA